MCREHWEVNHFGDKSLKKAFITFHFYLVIQLVSDGDLHVAALEETSHFKVISILCFANPH